MENATVKESASSTTVTFMRVASLIIITTAKVSLPIKQAVTTQVNGKMVLLLAKEPKFSNPVTTIPVTLSRVNLMAMVNALTRVAINTLVNGNRILLLVKESLPMLMVLFTMVTGMLVRKLLVMSLSRTVESIGLSIKMMLSLDPTSVNIPTELF